jgi:iron complex transport system substrate-binding protein
MIPSRTVGPERIISLAPSATSILCALGARKLLVGVSKWCKDVADVRDLPALGDCWSMDPAEVWALKPTLVIGSVPYKQETVGKLLEKPLTFLAMNPRRIAGVYSDIVLLGRITERGPQAKRLVAGMQRSFESIVHAARRAKHRPRVYAEAWSNPRISSPPWVAELVEMAGGQMIVPAGERIPDEQVAEARPDIIVLAWTATGLRADVRTALENPAWQQVPAVRERRVYVIRDEWLNTPSPILAQGARALFEVLHPELVRKQKAHASAVD